MEKFDFQKELKHLYASTKKVPTLVEVPEMNFIMFDGVGHPNDRDFQIAAEAVFTVSYLLKFEIVRKKCNKDYKVMPMEVIWNLDRSNGISFTWTMMIMQPPFITEEMFREAVELSIEKKKNIEHGRLRFETYQEGLCVQSFHLGDYNKMNDTLNSMILFAEEKQLNCERDTHDIYLNDSRKTKAENLKTIMRVKVCGNAR
jgi:hypothetical protein